MSNNLPVHICARSSSALSKGASVEEVIAVMGAPSEQWNDGVEAFVGYYFPTHEISFSFDVIYATRATRLKYCEIDLHHKLSCVEKYDVVTTSGNGRLRITDAGLTLTEASKRMSMANHTQGLASHWVCMSGSPFEVL